MRIYRDRVVFQIVTVRRVEGMTQARLAQIIDLICKRVDFFRTGLYPDSEVLLFDIQYIYYKENFLIY